VPRIGLPEPLSTPRLTLRELTEADAPFILALMNDESFITHIGDRGVRTLAQAREYIRRGPWTPYATLGFGLWLVELRGTSISGTPIGICGLLKRDVLPDPDIGFAFSAAFRSQGYAFEAATAVMAFGRDVLHARQILAIVDPSNTASVRLLGKLGFAFDRLTRMREDAADIALYAARFDTIAAP
jgi:[ribosomal protein S5]-alanine N-acetyltransferase